MEPNLWGWMQAFSCPQEEEERRSRNNMALNPALLTEKSNLLSAWSDYRHTLISTQSIILAYNPIHINGSSANKFSVASANYRLRISGLKPLGLRSFRVSSGGGAGDGFGGSGGGGGFHRGDGDSGGGDHGSDSSLLAWYLSLLAKHPVITKAVTASFLNLVGDLICQLLIDKSPTLDLKRTSIFTLLGLVLVAPTLHFWYLYLSKLVTTPGTSGAVQRLLLDQFIFAPIFIGTFLSTLMTLEGQPSNVIPKLKQEWFSSVVANWQLWIPFQFLNFRFVPQQFQVLASNSIALVWNVILSYKAHREVLAK